MPAVTWAGEWLCRSWQAAGIYLVPDAGEMRTRLNLLAEFGKKRPVGYLVHKDTVEGILRCARRRTENATACLLICDLWQLLSEKESLKTHGKDEVARCSARRLKPANQFQRKLGHPFYVPIHLFFGWAVPRRHHEHSGDGEEIHLVSFLGSPLGKHFHQPGAV